LLGHNTLADITNQSLSKEQRNKDISQISVDEYMPEIRSLEEVTNYPFPCNMASKDFARQA